VDRLEQLLVQLKVREADLSLARALVAKAIELGGTDDEILAAARTTSVGPLIMDLAMRPPGGTVSLATFAETSGLDPAFVRRTWSALGLPSEGPVPTFVSTDAAAAVHIIAFLAQNLGDDAAVGIARVVGAGTASLAEAVANATRIGAELPHLETGVPYDELVNEMVTVVRELLPPMWDAVGAVFRRHLALVSYQKWAPDEARRAVTTTRTIGFVDLVGSTEVLRSQTVADLAASIDAFEQLMWDVVSRHGGRVVKLIGDEAMFVLDSPRAACDLARELVQTSPQPVRVGLAHGEIVALHGDCYGPTVNLADRPRPG
jgi:adenylate cyclase